MKTYFILHLSCLMFLFSCTNLKKGEVTKPLSDFMGRYVGVIPCADCEGIRYDITLFDDGSFAEEMKYIGKSDEIFQSEGSWELINDSIILVLFNDETKYFQSKGEQLILLDKKGKLIKSSMAKMYELNKVEMDIDMSMPANMSIGRMGMMAMPMEEMGPDFIAHGNEPSWNLTIDFDHNMVLSTMEGMMIMVRQMKINKAQDAPVTSIRGKSDNQEIIITIKEEECSDGMSDDVFRNFVRVKVLDKVRKEQITFEGCGNYQPDNGLHDIWVLTHFSGKAIDREKFNDGEAPRFEFYSAEERVSGNSGCNNFNGKFYMAEKNVLQFGMMAMTRKMCPEMEIEDYISKMLSDKRVKYEIKELQLILTGFDGASLTFKKVD